MIDLKPLILQELLGSAALIGQLGGRHVWAVTAPDDPPDKYITFFELVNFDSNYADNEAKTSDIHMQVDVWSHGNTGPIAAEVNKIMESIGFIRKGCVDLYEKDTRIHHKALRYKTIARR